MWRKGKQERERRGASWQALRAVPALHDCADAAIDRIDDLATQVTRPAGAMIQRRGHQLQQLVLVLDGTLKEQAGSGHAVGAGELVGADALRGSTIAAATVVATSDVRLLVFGPVEVAEVRDLVEAGGQARIRAVADGARMRVLAPMAG